jgi:hypothetical protein
MRSYLDLAVHFISASKAQTITQKEVLAFVAKKRKSTTERVRGSIIKHNGGLLNPKLLAALGVYRERAPARWVKGVSQDSPSLMSYDCPVKRKVVSKILSYLSNKKDPTFATMAGHQGLDIAQFYESFPLGKAISFERDPEVAQAFATKFPSVPVNIQDFKAASDIDSDLAFYDSVGYACSSMDATLRAFNETKKAKVIAVTTINIKKFRNRGSWVDKVKAQYVGEDPTRDWIQDIMPNYKLVEEIVYTKTNVKGARAMRVFIFEVTV